MQTWVDHFQSFKRDTNLPAVAVTSNCCTSGSLLLLSPETHCCPLLCWWYRTALGQNIFLLICVKGIKDFFQNSIFFGNKYSENIDPIFQNYFKIFEKMTWYVSTLTDNGSALTCYCHFLLSISFDK